MDKTDAGPRRNLNPSRLFPTAFGIVCAMYLTRFEADGFRNLSAVTLLPHRDLTVLHGANGAGKSAVLEAIQCLATGHSFRTRQARDYVGDEASSLSLAGRLQDPADGREHRCGLHRDDQGEVTLRLDYRPASSIGEVARLMPVKALVPDSHRLIQEGPEERRRFIDWGCFHQSESFGPTWRGFRRALSQRNEVLRQRGSDDEVRSWDAAVANDGAVLDQLRRDYVEQLRGFVKQRMERAGFMFHMELELRSGWPEELSLAEALASRLEQHRRLKTTADGPHRADLAVKANGRLARPRLSRGQQKVLVYLMHLAQLDCLHAATGKRAIVLCDDLAAELDPDNLGSILEQLLDSGCQCFVSAADPIPGALEGALDKAAGLCVQLHEGQLKP